MSSMGGGIWPGVPRRRFVKACWTEVKESRLGVRFGDDPFRPSMAYGRSSCRDGLKCVR